MNLRFWRKNEEPIFDPTAGEIPEHLEVYPPSDWPARRVLKVGTLWFVGMFALVSADDVFDHLRNRQPERLVFVDGTSVVCATSANDPTRPRGQDIASVFADPSLNSTHINRPCTDVELAADGTREMVDGREVVLSVRNLHVVRLLNIQNRRLGYVSTVIVDSACYERIAAKQDADLLFDDDCEATSWSIP